MKLHRFIYTDIDSQKVGAKFSISDLEIIHQIKNVFRMTEGDRIIICDGNYRDYVCAIESTEKKEISILIEEINEIKKEDREIYTFVSLIKPAKFDDTLPHLVEVGATKIIPIITERTQKRNLKTERLKEIIKEATEQSGRGSAPELLDLMEFDNALKYAQDKNLEIFIFHTTKDTVSKSENRGDCALFVGPEGGFTEKEIQMAKEMSAQNIFLGENILRAETAGVVATYLASQKMI